MTTYITISCEGRQRLPAERETVLKPATKRGKGKR